MADKKIISFNIKTDTIRDLKEYAKTNYKGNLSKCIMDIIENHLNEDTKMVDPITKEYLNFLQIFRPAYENILKEIKQIKSNNNNEQVLEIVKNFQSVTLELLQELKKLTVKKL